MGLPPAFRTFHANQQPPMQTFRPIYPSQVPFPMNRPWINMADEPVGALTNNNGFHVEQQRAAKNRARSVDTRPRNHSLVRSSNVQQQQQQPPPVTEHHDHPPSQPTNHVAPSVENVKEQNVPAV